MYPVKQLSHSSAEAPLSTWPGSDAETIAGQDIHPSLAVACQQWLDTACSNSEGIVEKK